MNPEVEVSYSPPVIYDDFYDEYEVSVDPDDSSTFSHPEYIITDITYEVSAAQERQDQFDQLQYYMWMSHMANCTIHGEGGFSTNSFSNSFMPEMSSQFTTMGGGLFESGHDHEHCKSCESRGGHGKIVNGRCESCKQMQV